MPVNWYAGLILIVVLGLVSVAFARYEYRNPSTSTAVQPAVGTTWYAGIDFSLCGASRSSLPANTSTTGISTSGNGVMVIAPTKASQAGKNATLGRFVSGYKGLKLTAGSVQYPGGKLLTNGDRCAAGTPDAGKKGVVIVYRWPNVVAKKGILVTGDPLSLRLGQSSLVGVAFAPQGTKIPKSASVEVAVLQASSAASSTSTTTTPAGTTTTTTGPSSTTSTTK
ncbi:MAG TPA: hypothetical protein VMU76_07565 [Acidimicrobiales bacterium]|nr:hypothetical protein [Acidimicrobiales bacterium]